MHHDVNNALVVSPNFTGCEK